MVDFNKLLAERREAGKKLLAEVKDIPTRIVPDVPKVKKPSELHQLRHLLEEHRGELTEWENNFTQQSFNFLKANISGSFLSRKGKVKLDEIQGQYCGSDCCQWYEAHKDE